MLLRCAAGLLAAAALGGCPGPTDHALFDGGACQQSTLGNAGAAMELQAIAIASGVPQPLHDGDPIPLAVPSQGGYVLYVGARARNLAACGSMVSAQLLDADTGAALSNLDARSASFVEPADGFWQPRAADLQYEEPNIPACPDHLGKGLAGRTAILEVKVQDANGKQGRVALRVQPTCPAGDTRCACICGPDYRPGACH